MTEHQHGSGDGAGPTDPTAMPPQAWDPPPWPPPSWPEGQAEQPFGESASFVPTSPWVASSAPAPPETTPPPAHQAPPETQPAAGHPPATQPVGAPESPTVAQPAPAVEPPAATAEVPTVTGASPVAARPEDVRPSDGAPPSSSRGRGSRRSTTRRTHQPGDRAARAGATAPVAGWAPRAGAGLVDAAVALVPGGALLVGGTAAATSGSGGLGLLLVVAGYLVALGVGLWNHVLRQGSSGRTLGKSVLGLRLVGPDSDTPVGEGVAAVRVLAHVLDTLPLGAGWLWPLVDPGRRTVADAVCGTRVVRA